MTTYAERRRVTAHPVTQRRVVAAEWVKFRSLRSSWISLGITVVGLVGVGALVCWATNQRWSRMDVGERLFFEPVTRSLTGVYLAQLVVGVLGVLVVSGEYATGTIRATLAAVPHRLPMVWGKLLVAAASTLGGCLIGAFGAFFLGQQLLGEHGTTIDAPHAVRAVIGVALYLTVVLALGLGLGFCLRSTAGGIATLFALLLVVPVIVRFLPSSWANDIGPYLPSQAGSALYDLHPEGTSLAPWSGFAVMCAWAAAAVAAGAFTLTRRDA